MFTSVCCMFSASHGDRLLGDSVISRDLNRMRTVIGKSIYKPFRDERGDRTGESEISL